MSSGSYVSKKAYAVPLGGDEHGRPGTPDSGHPTSPSPPNDFSGTRMFESPDGVKRVVVTSRRTVLRDSTGAEGGVTSEVIGKQHDVFLEQALDGMSDLANPSPTSPSGEPSPNKTTVDVDTIQNMQRIRNEIPAIPPFDPARSRNSSDSSSQSWMTRETLRASFDNSLTNASPENKKAGSTSGRTGSTSGKTDPTSGMTGSTSGRTGSTSGRTGSTSETTGATLSYTLGSLSKFAASGLTRSHPGVTREHKPSEPQAGVRRSQRSNDYLENLLLKCEPPPLPAAAMRIRSIVPRDTQWDNHYNEILQAELGEEKLKKDLEKQNKIFETCVKKSSIFENIPLFFKNWNIKSRFERQAREAKKKNSPHDDVGALGYAIVVKNNNIPENEFFVPKRMFEVRAKHSSVPAFQDDHKAAWRSLSIKFNDHDYESPFDLVLHTGRTSPIFNVQSFESLYSAQDKGQTAFKHYLSSLPVHLEGVIEGVRQNIGSYTSTHYHSHVTYDFKAKDGKRRLARFRVVTADGPGDRGRLKPGEQRDNWNKLLLDDEEGDQRRHFLTAEWRRRVDESCITYSLQVQLREWRDGDTYDLYNPARAWDEDGTPWHDIVRIRLLSSLSDDIVDMTSFNVGTIPENTLGFQVPSSTNDFNVVPYIYKEIYQACFKITHQEPAPYPENEGVDYLIHIVTGGLDKAGISVNIATKCDLYICLIGNQGRTLFRRLNRKNKHDFTKGTRCTFTMRERFIGDLLCVKLYKDKSGVKSDWFLDYVVVSTTYNGSCYRMPCYRWFNDTTPMHVLRDGTPVLFDKESSYYLKRQRQAEVTMRQQIFQWRDQTLDPHFAGLPGYIHACDDIEKLPGDIMSEHAHTLQLEWNKHSDGKYSLFKKVKNYLRPRSKKGKTVEEACEADLADQLPNTKNYKMLQYIIRNWRSDAEFSRQILNGVMPQKIQQLLEMPPAFPITDEMVQGLLPEDKCIRDELENGRLYLVSYPQLDEFVTSQLKEESAARRNEDSANMNDSQASLSSSDEEGNDTKKKKDTNKKYMCAPMVMFYLKEGEGLIPLAIQLTQKPAPTPMIFTPLDSTGEISGWQIAKMWVRVAEANMHQFAGRILGVQLVLEPVAIAVLRNLPAIHPIHKLLYPYLEDLITVNTIYRKWVLSEDGALAEVMAIGNKGVKLMKQQVVRCRKFSDLNIPENFGKRGVLDPNQLPSYYYRDDSLLLWEAIRDFVIDIACLYYDGDEQVGADDELIAMLKDMYKNGYNEQLDVPQKLSTIEELIQFCTTIIFRATVQHSALTRGMADVYSYCLNAPPYLLRPPPFAKEFNGYDAAYVHSLLPPSEVQERYINAVLIMLQGFKGPKRTLGQYDSKTFTDEKAVIAIKSFQKQLREISSHISKRNDTLKDWNYEYLLPENIPAGISA